jgi:iron complex transport system substrate-binding protein
LAGGAGVGAALVLGGCGSDGQASAPKNSNAGSGAFPVTVTGKEGPATLNAAPHRVVACGYQRDTDIALALGAPLVGAVKNANFPSGAAPWQKLGNGVNLIDAVDGLPFEKIAALRPDLILASDDYTLAKDYPDLHKIAPTLSYQRGVGVDTWQDMTTRVGKVLGKSDRAAGLVKTVLTDISATAKAHSELAGKTFTAGPVSGLDSIYTTSTTSDASVHFYSELGMKLSPAVTSLPQSSTPGRAHISVEQLHVLDADVMILTYTSDSARKQLEGNPLFRQLRAVRRGSYVALDLAAALAAGFPSVLSIPYALKTIVPKLAAAARKS